MAFIKTNSIIKYSLNLGIRGSIMGLKFVFALFLGKYFPEEILGEYGLFSTTILVSYLLLSLSFDTYAAREILTRPKEQQLSYVRNVFVYFAMSFAVYAILGVLFLNRGVISDDLVLYFLILLFLETIIQILFSLFTILQMPTDANLILFLSQASWIVIAFVLWFIDPASIGSVGDIVLIWIGGNFIACVFGLSKVIRYYKGSFLERVDLKWIRSGLSVSLLFFSSAIGYKTIEFADRYFIEFKLGAEKLGVYIFYSQISNIMNAIINVTVILMLYPRLIENYAKGDLNGYRIIKRKMYQRVLAISGVVAFGAAIFLKFALTYIGKESFYQHVSVFFILLASNLAMNLSFIAHYCLYAMRKDVLIVSTTIAGSIVSIVLNYFLIDLFGITGAALATCISFSLIWILKSVYVIKSEKYQSA